MRYYVASLILHLAFFLSLATMRGAPPKAHQTGGAEAQAEKIVPKAVEVEMIEPPEEKAEITLKPPEALQGPHDCIGRNWYGGIGIESDFFSDTVTVVFPGYPGAAAGLQAGDKLISVNGAKETVPSAIRGTPGTVVTIVVEHAGQTRVLNIIRDRICTEKIPEP